MKKFLKSIFIAVIAVFAVQVFAMASAESEKITPAASAKNITAVKPVKYVFLFIGDGMSLPQRMSAEEFSRKLGKENLFINSMPNQAITTTSADNSFITDSAASGTAIACGEKTLNGVIGMAADRKRHLESIAKVAHDSGRKVGIITTVTINHATPSSFYAHNASRGNMYEIALDLVNSNFDYFGGGGVAQHNNTKSKFYKGNIYDLAEKAGYTVLRGTEAVKNIPANAKKVMSFGADQDLPYAIDRKDTLPLAFFVEQSIKFLDNEKGFFIMAEGGKIDYSGHSNDAGTNIYETIDFDNAVKVAYEFAKKHPDETLIVVTGDHETGGLTLGFAGTGYKSFIENIKYQKCSIGVFNKMVSLLSKDNAKPTFAEAKKIITENFGLLFSDSKAEEGLKLTAAEEKSLFDAFNRQFPNGKYVKNYSLARETVRIFNNKCALAWTSGAHTALPVVTTAYGVNGNVFNGMIDNTDIAKILKKFVR